MNNLEEYFGLARARTLQWQLAQQQFGSAYSGQAGQFGSQPMPVYESPKPKKKQLDIFKDGNRVGLKLMAEAVLQFNET